eukprot:TRINITY_DN44200_c0_g1_i1.p1 TRINITY_DN44200_c0_g1~~TRINITY_DN44200_c0_g1_i1.p1  ORF type:complete len:115 (+),score=9.10 TRINITY_DN44200_c0_g1_i1:50-346(+)
MAESTACAKHALRVTNFNGQLLFYSSVAAADISICAARAAVDRAFDSLFCFFNRRSLLSIVAASARDVACCFFHALRARSCFHCYVFNLCARRTLQKV